MKQMTNWSKPASDSEAARRAGGRRRYNSVRNLQAVMRRMEVINLVNTGSLGLTEWGTQTRVAAALGVSRATVCRDMKRLLEMGQACPCCGSYKANSTQFNT